MKVILALILFAGVAAYAAPAEKYTTKYDNIDVEEILNNQRLYDRYFNCLINNGKCTPEGQELKDNIGDALKSKCSKCSEKQKEGTKKVFKHLIEKKRDDYYKLEAIYDPEKTYLKRYCAEAKKGGFNLPDC